MACRMPGIDQFFRRLIFPGLSEFTFCCYRLTLLQQRQSKSGPWFAGIGCQLDGILEFNDREIQISSLQRAVGIAHELLHFRRQR